MIRFDVAIIGSGFAGTILARALVARGRSVVVVERSRHPRFALGESSTPLAALSLERLARRYDLPDLADLAAWGRWTTNLPQLERGLKRGFTFYAHQPGEPFTNDGANSHRLLVAASPNDRVADCHWLRSAVDSHLAERARLEGVELLEGCQVEGVERIDNGFRLSTTATGSQLGERPGSRREVLASFVVDASGPKGVVARAMGIESRQPPSRIDTVLLFQHFRGVRPLSEVVSKELIPPGPYPDERAAVHHLLAEGWMYLLRFDHGIVSAGIELRRSESEWIERAGRDPERAFWDLLARYPTLAAQFEHAEAIRPTRTSDGAPPDARHLDTAIGYRSRLQTRAGRAAGDGWLLLPHAYAFTSPLLSTGMAWSLLAVERVADLLSSRQGPTSEQLATYERLLDREADWLDRLITGAFEAMPGLKSDFDRFVAWVLFYFAAASYSEARQRLRPDERDWRWSALLGADDPLLEAILDEAEIRLADEIDGADLKRFMIDHLAPRDVAGLAHPAAPNLYPVDLEALVDSAGKLDLSRREIERALPRLRGDSQSHGDN